MEVSDGVEHPDPDPHRRGRRAERRAAGLADRPLDGQRPARRSQLQRPAAPGHAPALVAHPMDRPAPGPAPWHGQIRPGPATQAAPSGAGLHPRPRAVHRQPHRQRLRRGSAALVGRLQLRRPSPPFPPPPAPAHSTASRIVSAFVAAALLWWAVSSFDGLPVGAGAAAAARRYIATGTYLQAMAIGALLGWFYPALWLKDRIALRRRELLRMMPFFLDIITLCVEAGLNMHGAIAQAVAKGPQGTVREEFQRVLRDVRAGKARTESLRDMAERLNEPGVTQFVMAVIQAERMGMNLGPVLRAQADQQRSERFLRAEKLAMETPVNMLLPLIPFIFPCSFIVLLFPIAMKFNNTGL